MEPGAAYLPGRPPTSKSESFFLPPLSAATSQRGLLPLPAQVSFAFAGLRYFTVKVRRFVFPLALPCRATDGASTEIESNRRNDSVRRFRSRSTREEIAASTLALSANRSSTFIELSCFMIAPLIQTGFAVG